jgi:hypothetical protein
MHHELYRTPSICSESIVICSVQDTLVFVAAHVASIKVVTGFFYKYRYLYMCDHSSL